MGRSVSVPREAIARAYTYIEEDDLQDFDFIIEDFQESVKSLFPSFVECDKWLGREDHAVLENNFAYAGISEYCGLVCYWMVLKQDVEDVESSSLGLAQRWACQVTKKFVDTFGTLIKLGTFSNGEAVFGSK